jgi:hypothetical protein
MRLKSLEENMRNETSKPHAKEINKRTTPKRPTSQPRQPNTARVSHRSSEAIDRKRSISQPRASTAGKVLKQPNSETGPADKARSIKGFDSPRARNVVGKGERSVKNRLWAPRSKTTSDSEKENKEQNPNSGAHLNASHLEGRDDTVSRTVFDANGDNGAQRNEREEATDDEGNVYDSSA